MLETQCYRELTKKTKTRGLTSNSWLLFALIGGFLWILFVFWAIPMIFILYVLLWLLEYFDEDIYSILNYKTKIKSKRYFA